MVVECGSGEHISERIAEQIVDTSLDNQATQSETGGAEGQAYPLFQESSSASLQAATDLERFEVVKMVRQPFKQEHSTALAQLTSCIPAIMKFGAGTGEDPLAKVKGDYYGHFAEFATGDAENRVAEDACVACAGDTKRTEKDWVVTHPVRLSMKMNLSVFQHGGLQNPDEACGTADCDVLVRINKQRPNIAGGGRTQEW